MRTNITHVAMDTHKKEHTVAVVYADAGEPALFTVRNTVKDITKMVKKIQRQAPDKVHFCYEAGVCGFTLKRRRQDQPQWAMDIADRAMARLHKRYWRLLDRGKPSNVVVVALAREFAGFLWSVLQE